MPMPELPEVETVRRTLTKYILNRPIMKAAVIHPHISACGENIESALCGNCFTAIRRRGKFLILALEKGGCLLVHLRMTGQFVYYQRPLQLDAHTHFIMEFAPGEGVYFRDVRKFGRLWLLEHENECSGIARMGPEPFAEEFTADYLAGILSKSRCPIKAKLLDQHAVAGIGNIYADEILHASFLHPKRISSSLSRDEIAVLREAIITVLQKAIDYGGTTFRDYRDGLGAPGRFKAVLQVFRREGEACYRCGERIVRIKCAGRSSFFCPHCQKEE